MAGPSKLLIPIDFSGNDEVLFELIAYAREQGETEVTFVHILTPPSLPAFELAAVDYVQSYLEGMEKGLRDQMASLANDPRLEKVQVHTRLITQPHHSIAQELGQLAEETHADFLVTLAKHRTGLDYLLQGSHLMRILQRLTIPAWVLCDGKLPRVQRILFATDFSKESAGVFLRVASLAHWLGAGIFLAKVTTPADYETTRQFNASYRQFNEEVALQSLEARALIQEVFHFNAEELPLGIQQCAEDNLADMIVLATHGRRGFNLLMNGSVTQEVLEITNLPVVVYPFKED